MGPVSHSSAARTDRVFLTGGTGLVGSHVAARLRHAGVDVVALHRGSSDTTHLEALGCLLVQGDVTASLESLTKAMEGCATAVHAAAVVYGGADPKAIEATNVHGSARLARAAWDAGVRHLVHMSSVAVYGNLPGPVDEKTPLDCPLGERDAYARSKRDAEREIGAVWPGGDRILTVIRPSVIYGERDRLFTIRLARLATMPVVPILGGGAARVPVVYAGNVASAVERAVHMGAGGTFNLAEDEPTTQEQLVMGLAAALGRRPRRLTIPGAAARALVRLAGAMDLRVPGSPDLALARAVRLWTGGNPYRSTRIRETLDWSPDTTRAQALVRTARWLIERERSESKSGSDTREE